MVTRDRAVFERPLDVQRLTGYEPSVDERAYGASCERRPGSPSASGRFKPGRPCRVAYLYAETPILVHTRAGKPVSTLR